MHGEELGSKTEQCKIKYTDMRRKMVRGFTGALVVAGISLYVAKRIIDNRRRIDLEAYRSC
ncbi:hypothetical protein WG66_013337 [Moniliophthora roreri]|nr:hypothetical protein WG66_013337 [Moniliophthora roreri]